MENADKDRLLDAALNHVIFDGWSDATFDAAVEDTGIEPAVAKILYPRAGLDMAVASKLFAGPAWVLSKVRPPMGAGMSDLPGSFGPGGGFGK